MLETTCNTIDPFLPDQTIDVQDRVNNTQPVLFATIYAPCLDSGDPPLQLASG